MLTIEHINIIGCLNFIYPPTHPLVMISHFTMERMDGHNTILQ